MDDLSDNNTGLVSCNKEFGEYDVLGTLTPCTEGNASEVDSTPVETSGEHLQILNVQTWTSHNCSTEVPQETLHNIDLVSSTDEGEEHEQKESPHVTVEESSDDDDPDKENTLVPTKNLSQLTYFMCPECDAHCGTQKKWKAHIAAAHKLDHLEQLDMQLILNRMGKLVYKCNTCDVRFHHSKQFAALQRHRIGHLRFPKYIKCGLCETRYQNITAVKVHLHRAHHKIAQQFVKQGAKQNLMDYHCPVCNVKKNTQKAWRRHLDQEHNYFNDLSKKYKPVDDERAECIQCKFRCQLGQLFNHSLRHAQYDSYHCRECATYTSRVRQYCYSHAVRKHIQKGKRSFNCSYCDRKFDRLIDRRKHTQEVHKVSEHKCEFCERKYLTAGRLLAHFKITKHQTLK